MNYESYLLVNQSASRCNMASKVQKENYGTLIVCQDPGHYGA